MIRRLLMPPRYAAATPRDMIYKAMRRHADAAAYRLPCDTVIYAITLRDTHDAAIRDIYIAAACYARACFILYAPSVATMSPHTLYYAAVAPMRRFSAASAARYGVTRWRHIRYAKSV